MLINKQYYDFIFKPFSGTKILLCLPYGNVGDQLIWEGCYQLLKHNDITYDRLWNNSNVSNIIRDLDTSPYTAIFYVGGGNMGTLYKSNYQFRKLLEQTNKRLVVLPQSWTSPDDLVADLLFAREFHSIELYEPRAIFAHDLALSYELEPAIIKLLCQDSNKEPVGYFFRTDIEKTIEDNNKDPAILCKNYQEYLILASRYKEIHTNRLHFAICGLMVGNKVKLYSNSYFKNRAIYESSLSVFTDIEWVDV